MKRLLIIALLSAVFIGCKKKDDEPNSAVGVDFTSIRKFDIESNFLGTEGDAADDYRHEDWPQWVYDAFKPLESVNLQGYTKGPASIDALYPNACADTQIMRYFANQPLNLKIIIIDIHKQVLLCQSYHLYTGIHFLGFDYKALGLQPKTYYRVFYGFSAEGKPFYERGHIDIYKQQ